MEIIPKPPMWHRQWQPRFYRVGGVDILPPTPPNVNFAQWLRQHNEYISFCDWIQPANGGGLNVLNTPTPAAISTGARFEIAFAVIPTRLNRTNGVTTMTLGVNVINTEDNTIVRSHGTALTILAPTSQNPDNPSFRFMLQQSGGSFEGHAGFVGVGGLYVRMVVWSDTAIWLSDAQAGSLSGTYRIGYIPISGWRIASSPTGQLNFRNRSVEHTANAILRAGGVFEEFKTWAFDLAPIIESKDNPTVDRVTASDTDEDSAAWHVFTGAGDFTTGRPTAWTSAPGGFDEDGYGRAWLQIDLLNPPAEYVNLYAVTNALDIEGRSSDNLNIPVDFALQGSQDGMEFITLHSVVGRAAVALPDRTEYSFENTEIYRFIRLVITRVAHSKNGQVSIGQIELLNSQISLP